MTDYSMQIKEYIKLEIEVLKNLETSSINEAMNLLDDTRKAKGNIYVFGNGGSSSTASHIQNDFNKGISEFIKDKFNFVCLNDNISTVMAIANDIGFEQVFKFQLENKINKNDIIVAISGSGNSPNVLCAVEYAKQECGAKIIGLTGFDGGRLKALSDISLHAPVNSMQVTEDIHMIFDHLMMSIFYKTLAGKEHLKN